MDPGQSGGGPAGDDPPAGRAEKEIITDKDLELKVSIAGNDQLEYKKYFLI